MTLEMHSKCIRLRRFILHSEYGKMPAHDFLIGRNQPTVRPSQVKHPGHTVGKWWVESVNDVIVVAWFPELPGSRFSADTDSRSKKQRTAHKQKQKVNSWNYSRYVDQASLIYILTTCHPASLAEKVTWGISAPCFWELYKRNKQN